MSDRGPDSIVLTQEEARSIDAAAVRELGMSGMLLMENAARGVVDQIRKHYSNASRIVILCGAGNNGGDGLAVTRQLAACGISATALLVSTGKTLAADADANLKILHAAGVAVTRDADVGAVVDTVSALSPTDLIVDCLLGTGMRGEVRTPLDAVIRAVNQSAARVLAVDVPSGMNCDDGTTANVCIEADETVTFVGTKRGFENLEIAGFTGRISVAHIGLPMLWVKAWLDQRRTEDS